MALTQSLQRNQAHAVTRRTNISIATTVVSKLNYSAKFARRLFNPIIVLKDRLKPNTFAPTASTLYSAGKPAARSLFTNAVTITVITGSTLSTNSTQRKKLYRKLNLLNSNSTTSIVNIYSKPMSSSTPRRSSHSSILQRFTCPRTNPRVLRLIRHHRQKDRLYSSRRL